VETTKYVRKPFYVEAVLVTDLNMKAVATWAGGELQQKDGKEFIYLKNVSNSPVDRQTKAFAGDWILLANRSFKVYTEKSFLRNFEAAPEIKL
jgi:hypothetical protein